MVQHLDKRLLVLFQKLADWVQIIFGIGNFALARNLLIISLLSATSGEIQSIFADYKSAFSLQLLLRVVFCAIIGFYIWYRIKIGEHSCQNQNFLNANVEILAFWRHMEFIFLVISVFLLPVTLKIAVEKNMYEVFAFVYEEIYRLTFLCCLYFASVQPKPPSKSWIKKQIENIQKAIGLKPELVTN